MMTRIWQRGLSEIGLLRNGLIVGIHTFFDRMR